MAKRKHYPTRAACRKFHDATGDYIDVVLYVGIRRLGFCDGYPDIPEGRRKAEKVAARINRLIKLYPGACYATASNAFKGKYLFETPA